LNAGERGFLLLTSQLGNPDRKPLTDAQLRMLTERMRFAQRDTQDRELRSEDLMALGYGREMADRIVSLLGDEELLRWYLQRGEKAGCVPITRVSSGYPVVLRKRLGGESTGCLWAKGNPELLRYRAVSLVGSRDLNAVNAEFAREVGRQAAKQGYVLVSGNARGADREAQNACLEAGGAVISVVADELENKTPDDRMLFLSEEGFDAPFSPMRALHRNHVIHALGDKVFVAQATLRSGGTWDGTAKNLRFGWSTVYCFQDGSEAMSVLTQMGAETVTMEQLCDFETLPCSVISLFEQ
jgi:predicted Rossmann fold nucleotide-binding protein DprA/Smf involved in DNA uptake